MFRQKMIKEMLSYDPLVSDTACQNRAVALIALSRKVKKGKALTAEEMSFLDACALLTVTKNVEKNALGLIVKEVTDNEKIPEDNFAGVAVVSNRMRNELLARKKKEVAEMALRIIKAKCNLKLDEGLMFYNQSSAMIKLHSEAIPILPVYITAKMLLQYINRKNIPVLINIKRLVCDKETNELTKQGEAYFCYAEGKIIPAMEKVLKGNPDDGVIVFDMMSQVNNKVRKQSKFFTEPNFDDFKQVFQQQDFNLLVMLSAASHDSYQKTIVFADNDPLAQPVQPVFNIQAQKISLKAASMAEYRSLVGMAAQYGFFKKRLGMDHISISTIGDCQQRIKELAV